MTTLTEQTRKVAQQYRKFWQQGDLDGILSILSPNAEYITFSGAKQVRAKDVQTYVKISLPTALLDYIYHDEVRVDGDTAFSTYSFVYISPISGKKSSCRGCDVMTIRDGKIIRVHEYSSFAELGKEGGRSDLGKIALDEASINAIVRDTQAYFKTQPYLNPELSLDDVAKATGYSRNQLSYVFNQVFDLSFYQYINNARVDYFISQLQQPCRNITALATESGFSSMTTFYKFFKQKTDLTPKLYMQQL
ncbi:helix-turn-helix domain-containing protein [Dasania sp. GY-MA-18]|uniref:Helix-turn-helix domain-containing protein n=1 Tax=Dasania phycosphaerae TaxID=2950436 RepID=A0A9J6RN62_9GAMM|nr:MULTISPECIES: helix-turn-helix domain-containing protein [Dasania]MCR8923167.1 helix-turn-helix domain-containing protein [Dasania sp. GY-MA-18]MCZ0865599.1 helix-turn-helix domain-containing protein [Dasania phycosphaerae]MCZ0869324.1 helix-turn-helix domain-containing protein [Dasania phycosphaerae]